MFQEKASAESTWASKCEAVKPNENPTFQQMNCLLTNAAIEAEIPPEVVKAVASKENGWKQFNENGKPIISEDGGIGLMQITNQANYDQEKLKYDIYYNIDAGIEILNSMYDDRNDLPKIKGAGREVIENWYFPVMAYNGIKPINSPIVQSTLEKNTNAYQEKVFENIEQDSFLNLDYDLVENPNPIPVLGQFPFKTTDFQYDTNSDKNIEFLKKEYTLTDQMHTSTQLFKKGNKVFVTNDAVKVRKLYSTTSAVIKELDKNTILTINGPFKYDNKHQFVWYPVTVDDSKVKGYISSAYIANAPTVKTVGDNDTSVSGTAPAKSTILIMNGQEEIGSTTAKTSGKFIAKIDKQKAKTKLTVTFKDPLNTTIPSVTITVNDNTPPKKPTISTIKKTTKSVTVKTEPNATVQLKFGSKTIPSKKTNKYGKFTFTIKPQKTGTNVYVTATDAANNTSKTKTKVK